MLFKFLSFTLLCTFFLCHHSTVLAEAPRPQLLPQLHPLEKITVGPFDHFQSTSTANEEVLYFTQKMNLSPRIVYLDLKTGSAHDFTEITTDSESPAISPDGKWIAYIYYKNKSRGELCTQEIKSKTNKCWSSDQEIPSNPFWINSTTFGYLSKINNGSDLQNIFSIDLNQQTKSILTKGPITYVHASTELNHLIITNNNGTLELYNLKDSTSTPVSLSLPGISAFARFSPSLHGNIYIYFAQYVEDTNSDGVVDSKDYGTIFRIPFQAVKKNPFPEQLTTSNLNCNYPHPTLNYLYLTCGRYNSLNIFRIPLSGRVPDEWTLRNLENSHQTARDYFERILILYNLKYRFNSLSENEFNERLLMNSLFSQQINTTKYLIQNTIDFKHPLSSSLPYYLDALNVLKSTQHQLRQADKEKLLKIIDQIKTSKIEPLNQQLLVGYIDLFINSNNFAKIFSSLKWEQQIHPIQSYWLYLSLEKITEQNHSFQLHELNVLKKMYTWLLNSKKIDDETLVHYTLFYLQKAELLSIASNNSIVQTLLKSNELINKLVLESDLKLKKNLFLELDRIMNTSRHNYPLARGLFSIAAKEAVKKDDFKSLEWIATNWLRYQEKSNTEFALAREILSFTLLDRGYASESDQKYSLATSHFYGAVTMTDTLESHYGYMRTMTLSGEKDKLHERYDFLKNKNFIYDNYLYAKAIFQLHENPLELEKPLLLLSEMKTGSTEPLWHLARGTILYLKFINKATGFEIPQDIYSDSQRALNLALDLSHDNQRIRSSALTNLALLHYVARNYGLSSKYFEERFQLGFLTKDSEKHLRYIYSKALFQMSQHDLALKILESLPQNQLPPPLQDQKAITSMYAGQYQSAQQLYENLLKLPLPKEHQVKYYLALGFSQLKQKNNKDAFLNFQKTLEILKQTKLKSPSDLADQQKNPLIKERLELISLGFLSQVTPYSDQKFHYLLQKKQLLEHLKNSLGANTFKYEHWCELYFKTILQVMELRLRNTPENIHALTSKLTLQQDLINLFNELLKDKTQHLSYSLFRAYVETATLAHLKSSYFSDSQKVHLKEISTNLQLSYEQLGESDETMIQRKSKLKLISEQL